MTSTEHGRRATTRDVAALAGVSQPTVSIVLGGNPSARVAPETRERVLAAAAQLGYRPNVLARGLVQRRSFSIGIVVPDLRNPFFVDVVSGAERVAAEQKYAVLLSETGGGSPTQQIEALLSRLIDGIIIDALGAAALPEPLLAATRVVLIDEPSERWAGVASDAAGAGRLAAEHLLTLGHRDIGFIGPAVDIHAFRMRERGFLQTLRANGISIRSEWLRRAPATAAGGQDAMRALLGGGRRPRPTAVFCANDLTALGALKSCAALGVAVPERMSVVGCDDIELARLVTPELTTVTIPARELGARAARLLLRAIDGGPDSAHSAGVDPADGVKSEERSMKPARALPVKLAVRGTSAPPPGGA